MSSNIVFYLIGFTFFITCIALAFGITAYAKAYSPVLPQSTFSSTTTPILPLPSNLVYTDAIQTLEVKNLVNSTAEALIIKESGTNPNLLLVNETNGKSLLEVTKTGGAGIFHLRALHTGRPAPSLSSTGTTATSGTQMTDMAGIIGCSGSGVGAFTLRLQFGTAYSHLLLSVIITPSNVFATTFNAYVTAVDTQSFTIAGTFPAAGAASWMYTVVQYGGA